jgi:hypothetical protein
VTYSHRHSNLNPIAKQSKMVGLFVRILYDAFCYILSKRRILSPTDITAVLLTCRQFNEWTAKYVIDSAARVGGYPARQSLMGTFRCYCGRIRWNILHNCSCFIWCRICGRRLPEKLAIQMFKDSFCGFPCETSCRRCGDVMDATNTSNFRFVRGCLRCCRHDRDAVCGTLNKYEWYDHRGRCVRSLFADELAGMDNGSIPWDVIERYDPNHRLLALRKAG